MAQVFLSYDREDGPKARVIAQALERAGHFVWYDMHIKGGAEYGREIEAALDKSDAVIVLWSEQSVASAWVRDEAAAGRDKGCLIPVLLEPVNPPMGFRQYQNLDFSAWKGRGKPQRLAELLDSIDATGGPTRASPDPSPPKRPAAPRQDVSPLLKLSLIGAAVMAVLIILSIVLKDRSGTKAVYSVAVLAVDHKSDHLAHDLLVSLGQLQSANSGSFQLVSDMDQSTKADLSLEVAGGDQSPASASLVLKDDRNHSILWSGHIDQPSGKMADLQQQIAFTAGQLLDCTFDGLKAPSGRLRPQTLKLYLTACARDSEAANSDDSGFIRILQKVLADSPHFKPAWGGLLLAESGQLELLEEGSDLAARRNKLRKMIADAREVDPKMPEATLAEIALVPPSHYADALALADRAVRQGPELSDPLSARAGLLRRVGRMAEAIDDSRRAAALSPLSPYSRNEYISSLFYGGRFEAAKQELANAEQLWPGTATLEDMRFRYHLRYGDPKEALKIAQAEGMPEGMELFLRSRMNRDPADLAKLRAMINTRIKDLGAGGLSFYIQSAGEFGWNDDLFKLLLNWPKAIDLSAMADIYFRPQMSGFRNDPRFMKVAARAGLVDYWRKSGKWPDFCHEPLPYDCKAEAAKLS